MSETPSSNGLIHVAAGLIWGRDGRILITRRFDHAHVGGLWELPGGKLETGESPKQALVREIREELDIEVEAGAEFGRIEYEYPSRSILLIGIHALHLNGEPRLIGVADARWIRPEEIFSFEFPAADLRLFTTPEVMERGFQRTL